MENVGYLEDFDIDNDGNIVNKYILSQGKKTLVFVHASWCGHCVEAKKAYQDFANSKDANKVIVAAIQADGDRQSEKDLSERIPQLKSNFKGFPDYLLYNEQGVRIKKEIKGRDLNSIKKFVS